MKLKYFSSVMLVIALFGCGKRTRGGAMAPLDSATATMASFIPGSADEFKASGTDHVYFAYDRSDLDMTTQDQLMKAAEWLKRYGTVKITIEGHCDKRGTVAYNMGLGKRRAEAVKNFLSAQGVEKSRMQTISYGKKVLPAGDGDDEETHVKNRVSISVVQ